MIFIDGIILSQRHQGCREVAGMRSLSFREAGDINRQGEAVEEQEVIKETARWAWIQGSHSTAIRVLSHDGMVALAGNPGRWGQADNLFNLDLDGTIQAANRVLGTQQLPPFTQGIAYDPSNGLPVGDDIAPGLTKWNGARIWSIHLTQNYVTGTPENAKHVINWLDSQSIARVKKSRLGASTVIWGSLNYCQVEAYIKADEMLAHAKGEEAKALVKQSETYQWALQNGVVRVEVKAAKEYLRFKNLTHLGDWNMGTVHEIFKDRTEVLNRCKFDVDEFDINLLPSKVRMTAAAWLRGEDVSVLFNNRMSLYRHAKALRDYGIDITVKRAESFPIRIRTIEMHAASMPDFYQRAA
jgi:hypothetical protein